MVCGGVKDVMRYVAVMLTAENFAVIDAIRLSTDVVVGRLGAAATESFGLPTKDRDFDASAANNLEQVVNLLSAT